MHRSQPIAHSRPTIAPEDLVAVERTLRSEMIAAGTMSRDFERAVCNYIGGIDAIATASGKAALVLALSSLGLDPGDEVIVPTYVCRSVMDAILQVGCRPVLVDIAEDYCISPADIDKKITKRTKAIIAVHIFGISANISEILPLAKEHGIRIIEDCAQSIGGEIGGRKHGSLTDLSFFSFHATKVMTTGEGGMVVLNAPDLADAFQTTRRTMGPFFAMSDLQAALGKCQLDRLPEFIGRRRALAREYQSRLAEVRNITVPVVDANRSIYFRFPVRVRMDFDRLRNALEQKDIHIRKGVDSMLHHHRPGGTFPVADRMFRETVSLPIYPALEIPDVDYIVTQLKQAACNE